MNVTNEQRKMAAELAKKGGYEKLYLNDKGEFFTNESYAAMSVGYDKKRYTKVDPTSDQSQSQSSVKSTNDLGKAADVIAAIEAAETKEAVEEILKAEKEGKNRKPVVVACSKKLEAFMNANDSKEDTTDNTDMSPVLVEIEALTDLKGIEALLNIEKLGKNRPEVIEAAEKKIETLKNSE